jgi:hypothetical protein
MASSTSVLKRLARNFRYRPLASLVGSKLMVTSFDAVEGLLRALVAEHGLRPAEFEPNNFRAAIAKYELIDVSFEAPAPALDHGDTQRGLASLEELGFLDAPEGETGEAMNFDGTCIKMLADDVDRGACYVKLLLRAETERDRRKPAVLRQMRELKVPDDYFPRPFVVRDACVTNAGCVWLAKHIWL